VNDLKREKSNQASPTSSSLKADDRPGVERDYVRDGNLTTVYVGPSFLMKKNVIDKTLTFCLLSFFYPLAYFWS
jgi:hypothetical protein